jgi:hypothetical protein
LLYLIARWIKKGLNKNEVITAAKSAMLGSNAPRDDRWKSRFNEIERMTDGAIRNGFGTGKDDSQTDRPKFRLTSVADLLQEPTPTEQLIRDFLPPEGLAFVIGPPAGGKSLTVLDWACCIALGIDWHGHAVKHGPVVIIAGEGHHGMSRRLKAWAIDRDRDLAAAPIAVSDTGAQLVESSSLDEVTEAIDGFREQHGDPALIVVDTLHRNFGPGDENSAQDVGTFVHHLDKLRTRYKCLVLTVHHSGHGAADRGRGSSAIRASADVEFLVNPKGTAVLELSCQKMKDAAKPPAQYFSIEQVELPWKDFDGFRETSVVIKPTSGAGTTKGKAMPPAVAYALKTLADAIHAQGGGRVALEQWRDVFYIGHTGDTAETKKKAFQRARTTLVENGAATVLDDTYALTDLSEVPWTDAAAILAAHDLTRPKSVFDAP